MQRVFIVYWIDGLYWNGHSCNFSVIVFASRISMTKIDWTPSEKDYTYHFMSAICEWTVAFGFVFFFLTFIKDFQRVTLRISTEIHEDS